MFLSAATNSKFLKVLQRFRDATALQFNRTRDTWERGGKKRKEESKEYLRGANDRSSRAFLALSRVLCSFAARRCMREETRTFKLRSELISVEDKRNESEREKTGRRETEILGELRANKGGGRNGHVAGVPRSTAHNARKRIEWRGKKGGRVEC